MKRLLWSSCLSVAIALGMTPAKAITVQDVPNPRDSWVIDVANVLSPTTEDRIERLVDDLVDRSNNSIVVVTLPDTVPAASPRQFASDLLGYWNKNSKRSDVLMLVSIDERRVEVQTSAQVSSILTSNRIDQILQQQTAPFLRHQNFDRGILNGTQVMASELLSQPPASSKPDTFPMLTLVGGIIFLIWISRLGGNSSGPSSPPSTGSPGSGVSGGCGGVSCGGVGDGSGSSGGCGF